MIRRTALVLILVALAAPVMANDRVDQIIAALQREGFTQIETSRTLLGRTRIVARGASGLREIVVHPTTGEVLRDAFTPSDTNAQGIVDDDDDDGQADDDGDDDGDDGGDDNDGGDGGGDGGDGGDD